MGILYSPGAHMVPIYIRSMLRLAAVAPGCSFWNLFLDTHKENFLKQDKAIGIYAVHSPRWPSIQCLQSLMPARESSFLYEHEMVLVQLAQ